MKKNKLLSLVIIILVLTVLMISCKQEPSDSAQWSNDSAQWSNSSSFKYSRAFIDAHRPKQFSLLLASGSSPAFMDLRVKSDLLYKKQNNAETYLRRIVGIWLAQNAYSGWEIVDSDDVEYALSSALEVPYAYLYCYLSTDSTQFVKGTGKTIWATLAFNTFWDNELSRGIGRKNIRRKSN